MIQHFFDKKSSSLQEADVVVAPLPFDKGIRLPRGAALGPQAILDASEQLELFDVETRFDFSNSLIHTVAVPNKLEDHKSLGLFIQSVIQNMEVARQFYLGLGGDHSVSFPAILEFKKKYGDLGIIQIDAHADLRKSYELNPNSHACVMRKVAEVLDPSHILSIGVRATCEEEYGYMKKHGVHCVWGNRSMEEDLLPELNEKLARIPDKVFLTIDLDGLDPSVVPHVQTPVPGGISWYQCMAIVRRLFERKTVIAADVVELAACPPHSHRSDFLASLLCQKIMYHVLERLD